MKLEIVIPADACQATNDVSWMQFFRSDGSGGNLLDIKVLLVFESGTLELEKEG